MWHQHHSYVMTELFNPYKRASQIDRMPFQQRESDIGKSFSIMPCQSFMGDSWMKVEIRYLVDRADGNPRGFESYIKNVEEMVTPVGVEKVIKSWLDEKVKRKNIIISDIEIMVNGIFYILEQEDENKLFKRIGAAAGK
jgi:hypothetical protein